VGIFHDYLMGLNTGQSSYNKHFRICIAFFNHLIEKREYNIPNAFSRVTLKFIKKNKTIITVEEFDNLLNKITFENGYHKSGTKGKRKNYYRPFMKDAFRLALETGVRREELITLCWADIDEDENVINTDNKKVNRQQEVEDKYVKFIPLTKSLMDLLIELGYESKKGSHDTIINWQKDISPEALMSLLSRSFGHYIKLVTNRRITLKSLRKTYITYLAMVLGEKVNLFTGHSTTEVLKTHYIRSAQIAGSLSEFRMFQSGSKNGVNS
jgi:integrase